LGIGRLRYSGVEIRVHDHVHGNHRSSQ
jgi:hypothetical protein